jgi:hypothetical protein
LNKRLLNQYAMKARRYAKAGARPGAPSSQPLNGGRGCSPTRPASGRRPAVPAGPSALYWPHTGAPAPRCDRAGIRGLAGYANKGEKHEDTIAREIREETGTTVKVGRLLHVNSGYKLRIEIFCEVTLIGGLGNLAGRSSTPSCSPRTLYPRGCPRLTRSSSSKPDPEDCALEPHHDVVYIETR